jgi:hypothetical protein
MAGGDHATEATGTPEPVEKGFATLSQIQYVDLKAKIPTKQRALDSATVEVNCTLTVNFAHQNWSESIR